MHHFDLQPLLENEKVVLLPLKQNDFEELYAVACDPLIWEQHPNPLRYQREVFQNFFEGAMQSGGAFTIRNKATGEAMGSSRFYDYDPEKKTVLIGYTFLGRKFWGGQFNREIKSLMLEHAFRFVENVHFHIGSENKRSQIAMERIGGKKIGEEEVTYHGEKSTLNFVYEIEKKNWIR